MTIPKILIKKEKQYQNYRSLKIKITNKKYDFLIEKRSSTGQKKNLHEAVETGVLSTVDGNGGIRSEGETRKELEHNGTNSRLCDGMTS